MIRDVVSGFDFETVSGVSAKTGKAFVLNRVRGAGGVLAVGQVTPDEARAMGRRLFEAAEAAIHDAAPVAYAREKLGLDLGRASAMLGDLREYRQERGD